MRKLLLLPAALLITSATMPPPAAPLSLELLLAAHWCGDASPADEVKTVILPGYGGGGFTVRTANADAQAFFTNGMQLAHAFAHKAAIKAFGEARRLDPNCAMCAWGEAWSSGPTINYGVEEPVRKQLAETVATAEKLAADGPPLERALIAALKLRYQGTSDEGNHAFADVMAKLVDQYPQDDEIAVIAADAEMIAVPSDDWNAETMARPVALLETVLKRSPDFTPAIHFYIHATEGAGYPARAEHFADRLPTLAPAASHLIHMPSHTYYWIGRYEDAAQANVKAVAIGEANATRLKLGGNDPAWQLTYHAHNVHYGIGGALMAGDSAAALSLARPAVAAAARAGKLDPFRQIVIGEAYVALAHFAPRELLAVADPGQVNDGARMMWRYARAEAYAALNDRDALVRESHEIDRLPKGSFYEMGAPLAKVARLVIAGRIATMRGDAKAAAKAFAKAATLEETRPLVQFSDPPIWWYPVRRDLAAALLAEGDAKGALAAVDASLARRPNDPIALEIRAKAQSRLGNAAEAKRNAMAAARAWAGTPTALVRSAG